MIASNERENTQISDREDHNPWINLAKPPKYIFKSTNHDKQYFSIHIGYSIKWQINRNPLNFSGRLIVIKKNSSLPQKKLSVSTAWSYSPTSPVVSPLVPYIVYVTCAWEEADQGILILIPDALGRQWAHHLSPLKTCVKHERSAYMLMSPLHIPHSTQWTKNICNQNNLFYLMLCTACASGLKWDTKSPLRTQ